jgi:hypothetical protein
VKLSPDDRCEILKEMQLVDLLFNTKRWADRFRISERQVKRLRAEARELLMAPKGPLHVRIVVSNDLISEPPAGSKVNAA